MAVLRDNAGTVLYKYKARFNSKIYKMLAPHYKVSQQVQKALTLDFCQHLKKKSVIFINALLMPH